MGNYGTDVGGPFSVDGTPVGPGAAAWHQGKVFYVDGEQGADGHSGLEARQPMKTLSPVYDKLTSQRGDKIILMNDGATGSSMRLAETLVWSKSNNHLWGTSAPTVWSHRSRITGESGAATFTPLMTVSGNGNSFANFSMFHDYGVDPICLNVTGGRNSFYNCAIHGMGALAGAADTAALSMFISGDECYFEKCTFGLDTVLRAALNAQVEIDGVQRVYFKDCLFQSWQSDSTALMVDASTSGAIGRVAVFENCLFYNNTEAATGTAMDQAFNLNNGGGLIILDNCKAVGITNWAAADNGNIIMVNMGTPVNSTGGLGIAATR